MIVVLRYFNCTRECLIACTYIVVLYFISGDPVVKLLSSLRAQPELAKESRYLMDENEFILHTSKVKKRQASRFPSSFDNLYSNSLTRTCTSSWATPCRNESESVLSSKDNLKLESSYRRSRFNYLSNLKKKELSSKYPETFSIYFNIIKRPGILYKLLWLYK